MNPEKIDHVNTRKRKGSSGGRPPKMDWEAYKGRNVVERSLNLLKQWRELATRYDKLAVVYRGAVVLAAIVAWVKALGDTPQTPWSQDTFVGITSRSDSCLSTASCRCSRLLLSLSSLT
ncbi:transposase [Corynebacterium pacaense]|uniref:transposase n=1 Tax=Corynebacterium pacaense TaxID=1816684 RepID=UPI001FED1F26